MGQKAPKRVTTSQRSSTAYFAGTQNISRHEGIL
jgi:hypothetical protein